MYDILTPLHEQCGLSIQMDDHTILLCDNGRPIPGLRWTLVGGFLAKDEIQKCADEYLGSLFNRERRELDRREMIANVRGVL